MLMSGIAVKAKRGVAGNSLTKLWDASDPAKNPPPYRNSVNDNRCRHTVYSLSANIKCDSQSSLQHKQVVYIINMYYLLFVLYELLRMDISRFVIWKESIGPARSTKYRHILTASFWEV